MIKDLKKNARQGLIKQCNVVFTQKSANHRILAMGGGGGGDLAKIVQDMTFKRFDKYPRYKSSWGRFIPGVKPTQGYVKIL